MATPPTFVAEYESVWNTTAAKSVSVTVAAGDTLVVFGVTEDSQYTLNTPTGGSLTYTLQQSVVVSSYTSVFIWTAPCPSSQSFTLQVTSNIPGTFGINVARFSGSSGIGASSKTNVTGSAPSLGLTTTGANSAIVAAIGDWNAIDGTSRTWRTVNGITPTAGNGQELTYSRQVGLYVAYGAYWSDAGTAGSKTVGVSSPSGQAYAIVAVEVLGVAGGSAFTATVNDSAGITDAAAVTSAFARTVDDAAGLTDASARAAAFVVAITDTAGLTDGASAFVGFTRTQSDGAGLADSVSTQLFSGFVRTVDDSAGLTDSRAVAQTATVTDAAGLTDSRALDWAATVNDAAGLTDSVSLVLTGGGNFTRTVDDSAGLSDAASAVSSFARTQSDTAGLTDAVSQSVAGAGTRQVDDAAGFTDAVVYSSTQTLTDGLGLADMTSLVVAAARVASDALGLTDTVTAALTRSVTVTDSAGLTDSASRVVSVGNAYVRIITDSAGLTSEHQARQLTQRPSGGVIDRLSSGVITRPNSGVISRYPFVPD